MIFQWLIVGVAIAGVAVMLYADFTTRKKKVSYFETVQKPTGKAPREIKVSEFNKHDGFYSKLNG